MEGPDAFLGPCEGALEGDPPAPVTVPSAPAEEEEEGDEERFRGVPLRRPRAPRTPGCSRDPFRRHSWEPGTALRGGPGCHRLSVSPDDMGSSAERLGGPWRDPRRAPLLHSNDDLGSLLSEEDEADAQQEDARYRPSACALSKSASLGVIDTFPDWDDIPPFASQQSLFHGSGSLGQLAGGGRDETPLGRTLSFIRRMTGKTKVRGG
ncbi:hypothetical protein AV530_009237 [Patagioenas fasciata monilis]|uniref:Uncharacterized protein n=1 Tax=Patagioenas fasciata monilis TaxID=372326 RepID=A0A1V4KMI0_PATFA|nr:hypothetical protein AV530_009237 [Patagioenas fasciata monilis]